MLDEPRLLVSPPRPDRRLEAIVLHVDAAGQHQRAAGQRLRRVRLAPRGEAHRRNTVAALLEGLAERGVDPGLQRLRQLLGLHEGDRHVRPRRPRRVELADVKRRDAAALAARSPLAGAQHLRLVGVGELGAARDAGVHRELGLPVRPAHLRPDEPLQLATMHAGHLVEALVAGLEARLDARRALDGRRGTCEHLASCPCRARLVAL